MKFEFKVGELTISADNKEDLDQRIRAALPGQEFLGSLFLDGRFIGKIAARRKREEAKEA